TRGETENISRHSNDQCALHFAIRGERNNYTAYPNGKITLSESGVCTWEENTGFRQGYIQKARDKDLIAEEIEALMMQEIPEIDMSPPSVPQELVMEKAEGQIRLSWEAAEDDTEGGWVVAYHLYVEDELVKVSYGIQAFLPLSLVSKGEFELRAVNAAGIESESTFLTL
ncbi:MAG: hypothetical protein AAGC85_26985, partial [Bacteroidota bacterium]